MTIETKFNIWDKVYFLSDNRCENDFITHIRIEIYSNETKIIYDVKDSYISYIYEDKLFKTKEELVKDLIKEDEKKEDVFDIFSNK